MAAPLRGRTFGMKIWRERVEGRVARLERLIELRAPEVILDEERRRIHVGLIELAEAGWTKERDPLSDHVMEVINQVLDAVDAQIEHAPSAQLVAQREERRRFASLIVDEPPPLRLVPADGRLGEDEDDET